MYVDWARNAVGRRLSVQDWNHHLAELASPAFIPLLDHFVPQFSLYRKKVIFPSC